MLNPKNETTATLNDVWVLDEGLAGGGGNGTNGRGSGGTSHHLSPRMSILDPIDGSRRSSNSRGGNGGDDYDDPSVISSGDGGSTDFDKSDTGRLSVDTDQRNQQQNDINKEEVKRLALQETKNVNVWRRNVFVTIFAAATLVTTLTYWFLRQEDQEDFQTSVRTDNYFFLFFVFLFCFVNSVGWICLFIVGMEACGVRRRVPSTSKNVLFVPF